MTLLKEKFTPMYFLASLGAGGLSVSFFMYLMFLIPHPKVPLATFDFIFPELLKGTWLSFVTAFCLVFIIGFAFIHFKLLIWNVKQYNGFKETDAYEKMKNSNAEVTFMAMPLTFAMTINVCFVLGAAFVPGLWDIVEYLFPGAIIAFAVCGYYALKFFTEYFTRIISNGDFDSTANNNLSQMVSIFSFSMIAVGFAAPGAMSHHIEINAIGIFGAIFFGTIAFLLLIIKLILGFKDMFEHGIGKEASPSLWIMIPILTLLGITLIRVSFGLDHHFGDTMGKADLFILTSVVITLQIIFGLLGLKIMKNIGYFEEFVHSNKKSPVAFALICPGVAFMVFGFFFINFGLTFSGVIEKYSVVYFLLMLPFMYVQFKTVQYFFTLKNKFF
jgi:hypothetical protein